MILRKLSDLLDEAIKRDKNLADAYIVKGDALMLRNEGGAAVTAYEYALTAKAKLRCCSQSYWFGLFER